MREFKMWNLSFLRVSVWVGWVDDMSVRMKVSANERAKRLTTVPHHDGTELGVTRTNSHDALALAVPRQVLDLAAEGLELTLANVLCVNSVPHADLSNI